MIKKPIPQFQSEAEEAQWWDAHREETAEWTEEAIQAGKTSTLSSLLERAREKNGVTPTVSIRIDPEDIRRARLLAAQRGLRYQTYLKMLIHEALEKERPSG